MHQWIQAYMDELYRPYDEDIKHTLLYEGNERYGEVYYYSLVTLLKHLKLSNTDHVLDIGSGLGKVMVQLFLTSKAASVTGIEINPHRHVISKAVKETMQQQLPELFSAPRRFDVIQGDFLTHDFLDISVIYVCSTIFSFDLLHAIGNKINTMMHVKKVVSFKRLPHLKDFKLVKMLYLHCSWDMVACYLYERRL